MLELSHLLPAPLGLWVALAFAILAIAVFLRSGGLTYLVTHHRWLLVILFVAPGSLIYDVLYNLRARIVFAMHSAPKLHDKRVAAVARDVKAWAARNDGTRMCTARPGWLSVSLKAQTYKATSTRIPVNLMDILDVDVNAGTVKLEPMVTMGQVTATLAPLGWTLPVLPELDDLTVGGVVCGEGVETASFKYGLFQHTIVAMELVTAQGDVVVATGDNEHRDLFYNVPWSHGTLAFLVSVTLRMVPAKPWVRLQYQAYTERAEGVNALASAASDKSLDFVEGLAFSPDHSVVMTGTMVDAPDASGRVNRIGKWWKPWFFSHAKTMLKHAGQAHVEFIPLRDYYHRHTRGLFWEMQDIVPFGNHPLFRRTLGWMFPPKISFLKATQTREIKELYKLHHAVQDVCVPMSKLEECWQLVDRETGIYPLWMCPMRVPATPVRGLVNPTRDGEDMFVDVGIYGVPTTKSFHHIRSLKAIEAWARDVDAIQFLYATIEHSEAEFRTMFDHSVYDKLRARYGCAKAFPSLFSKVSHNAS